MFNGIIHHQGIFMGYRRGKQELLLEAPASIMDLGIGESVSVNGVCLSLVRREKKLLFFNLSQETISRSNLGSLKRGESLNIELPLTLQTLLSGHLVTGHIDGKGRVLRIVDKAPGRRVSISFSPDLRPYFVPQGSVAVNGVSLTVARIERSSFDVELIPLTIAKSNLKDLKRGQEVNLECDILGKYVYNWISRGKAQG